MPVSSMARPTAFQSRALRPPNRPEVGSAALLHDLLDREREWNLQVLWDERDLLRNVAARA
jgi:hypothetical protein